ncbi:DNA-binding protein [Sphingopyxis bauzanensis]|jgi:predicted nucleic-acid-binding protein|nr:DNA-binding protein [Sphingopyxis bauzanensis]
MQPLSLRLAVVRAIDTNIIVRFLTRDDKDQAKKAHAIIGDGDLFIATSVMLESEWVLRSAYGFSSSEITSALRSVAGLPGIILEDALLLAQALEWTDLGMDFADALHLARARDCDAFFTFDKRLAKAAGLVSDTKVIVP